MAAVIGDEDNNIYKTKNIPFEGKLNSMRYFTKSISLENITVLVI